MNNINHINHIKHNETYIDRLDSYTVFWYVIIFILIIYIFAQLKIGINILLGFIIAIIILIYLYTDYQTIKAKNNEIIIQKENLIVPEPSQYTKRDHRIIDYLFSIMDFYQYNPEEFNNMIKSIDHFYYTYQEITVNSSRVDLLFPILLDQKQNALNSLNSVSFHMTPNHGYDKKVQIAIGTLTQILNDYIDKVIDIHKDQLYEHGYNINTKLINNSKIVPINHYEDNGLYTNNLY